MYFRKEEDTMEKYEKPVMMLDEIIDEIRTATTAYQPVPNNFSGAAMVSGEAVITNTNTNNTQTLVPGTTYVP